MVLTAASYQLLSNLANDLGDYRTGADQHRQGLDGIEARAVASGLIREASMHRAVQVLTLMSLVFTALTAWWGTRDLGWVYTAILQPWAFWLPRLLVVIRWDGPMAIRALETCL